jgi:endogenous inhibitor of DNA gyrase (YacG/DUF329 family)
MKGARCPICDRPLTGAGPADRPFAPFCGARCRRIDLGRWLGESYRIPEDDTSVTSDVGHDDDGGGLLPPIGP